MGASWAILQPFFTMIIFSVFFGRLAGVPSDGIPYPLFSYAALVPWTFFANGVQNSSNCLINNPNLIKKIYFPRMAMPISAIIAGLLDFVLAFSLLILMMLYFRYIPDEGILWIPLFLILALIITHGVGFWLSAMNVQFRDVRYVVPFLIQAWLFATPIAYPSSLLSGPWKIIYGLNPMASVVEGFRWALLNTDAPPVYMVILSFIVALVLFISGMYYFRKTEKVFADIA